jgi:hypothetical protein
MDALRSIHEFFLQNAMHGSGDRLYSGLTSEVVRRYSDDVARLYSMERAMEGINTPALVASDYAALLVCAGKYQAAETVLKQTLHDWQESRGFEASFETSLVSVKHQLLSPPKYYVSWQLADCLNRENKLSAAAYWYKKTFQNSLSESHTMDIYTTYSRVPTKPYVLMSGGSGESVGDPIDNRVLGRQYIDVLNELGRTKEAKAVEQQLEPQVSRPIYSNSTFPFEQATAPFVLHQGGGGGGGDAFAPDSSY